MLHSRGDTHPRLSRTSRGSAIVPGMKYPPARPRTRVLDLSLGADSCIELHPFEDLGCDRLWLVADIVDRLQPIRVPLPLVHVRGLLDRPERLHFDPS